MRNDLPDIPEINDEELKAAVRALTSSADIIRSLLVESLSGKDKMRLMIEHQNIMLMADAVITKWLEYFPELNQDQSFSNN